MATQVPIFLSLKIKNEKLFYRQAKPLKPVIGLLLIWGFGPKYLSSETVKFNYRSEINKMKGNFYNRIYTQSNSTLQWDLIATVTDRKFKVANFSVSMTYFLVPWIIAVALSKKINWALIATTRICTRKLFFNSWTWSDKSLIRK